MFVSDAQGSYDTALRRSSPKSADSWRASSFSQGAHKKRPRPFEKRQDMWKVSM